MFYAHLWLRILRCALLEQIAVLRPGAVVKGIPKITQWLFMDFPPEIYLRAKLPVVVSAPLRPQAVSPALLQAGNEHLNVLQ